MKIDTKTMVYADQAIDRYGIGLSTLTNLVNLILKVGISFRRWFDSAQLDQARQNSSNPLLWKYLEEKGWGTCVCAAIPILGNMLITLSHVFDQHTVVISSITTPYRTKKAALYKLAQSLDNFKNMSVELLYDRDCLIELLRKYPSLKSHSLYLALDEAYRKDCETALDEAYKIDCDTPAARELNDLLMTKGNIEVVTHWYSPSQGKAYKVVTHKSPLTEPGT